MSLRMPVELATIKNVHIEKLLPMILESRCEEPKIPLGLNFVFICYTNRCGSNLIAELLATTGHFNLAGEFLNYDTVLEHAKRHNFATVREFFVFLSTRIARNNTLICKLSATHLAVLEQCGILSEIIPRSKFVYVERSDRLAQAISLAIASQTGQWTSQMVSRAPDRELTFNKNQIDNIIHGTIKQQSVFVTFFAINGIDYFTLVYEQVTADPDIHVPALCRWLGIQTPAVQKAKVKIEKQSSSINLLWRAQYLGNSEGATHD